MSKEITARDKEISITKTYDLSKPTEAVQMAVMLKKIVIQQKLYVDIKGKNYATVDAWQLAGFLTGMSVMLDEPKNLSNDKEVRYSATAKVYQGEKIVSVGYAVCSNKEAIKKQFDEFAILSMAQTRAIGKAYRNKIGFIMKLAGFQSTPGEEMHKVDEIPKTPVEPVIQMEEGKGPKYVCLTCDIPVSEQVANYSKTRYGKILCREHQPKPKK